MTAETNAATSSATSPRVVPTSLRATSERAPSLQSHLVHADGRFGWQWTVHWFGLIHCGNRRKHFPDWIVKLRKHHAVLLGWTYRSQQFLQWV